MNTTDFSITLKFLTDELRATSFPHSYFLKPVKDLKVLLFPSELSSNKTIKLIYKGRLMQDVDILSTYSLIEKDVLHVVIINNEELLQINDNNPVNNANNNNNNENNNNNIDNLFFNNDFYMQIVRQGFDRFSEEAFLEEDIEILREIHHVGYQIDKYSITRTRMYEKEENLMRNNILLLRAQLIKIKDERIKKEKGTYIHFIVGAILGYFFNVLILLLMVFYKSPKYAMLGTLFGFLAKIAVISFNNVHHKGVI